MKDGRTRPLYFSVSREETYVIHDNRVTLCNRIHFINNLDLHNSDAIMIADFDTLEEPVEVAAHRIVLSSPDVRRYKQLQKYSATRFIFNPWSKADVIELWRKNEKQYPMKEEEVLRRLGIFGGIPRLVFSSIGRELLQEALDKVSGNFKAVANFVCKTKIGDKEISYKLLQMRSIDNTFHNVTHDVASDFVAREIIRGIDEDGLNAAIHFMSNSKHPFFQSAVGSFFEEIVKVSSVNREILSVEPLVSPDHNSIALFDYKAFCEKDVRQKLNWTKMGLPLNFKKLSMMHDFSSLDLKKGVLVNCAKKNFESLDAFAVVDGHILAFQVTVASTHSVKAKGLEALVKYVESQFPGESFNCHLMFLCPAQKEAVTFIQRITPGKTHNLQFNTSSEWKSWYNTTSEVPECIKSFIANQWVVHVQLNSIATTNVLAVIKNKKELKEFDDFHLRE